MLYGFNAPIPEPLGYGSRYMTRLPRYTAMRSVVTPRTRTGSMCLSIGICMSHMLIPPSGKIFDSARDVLTRYFRDNAEL
jgi:hypothetical protein